MQQRNTRFPWIALFIGLVLGLMTGLYYAWFVNPVTFVNIAPDQLSVEDQREYIQLIADAYLQEQDIGRARERLAVLGVRDVAELVSVQADSALLRGADTGQVRALSTLAEALGGQPLAADVFSGTVQPTSETAEITRVPTGTPTTTATPEAQQPTATPTLETPTATPVLFPETELSLVELEEICVEGPTAGRIEVYVRRDDEEDAAGVPGIEVQVAWENGQDTFYTGLKPGIDPGYADFVMEAEQRYQLTLVGLSEPVVGLESSGCRTTEGRTSIPSYRLLFVPVDVLEN